MVGNEKKRPLCLTSRKGGPPRGSAHGALSSPDYCEEKKQVVFIAVRGNTGLNPLILTSPWRKTSGKVSVRLNLGGSTQTTTGRSLAGGAIADCCRRENQKVGAEGNFWGIRAHKGDGETGNRDEKNKRANGGIAAAGAKDRLRKWVRPTIEGGKKKNQCGRMHNDKRILRIGTTRLVKRRSSRKQNFCGEEKLHTARLDKSKERRSIHTLLGKTGLV